MSINANESTTKVFYFSIIFLAVSLITILSVHNGSFYDDEIFNLDHVQGVSIPAIWKDINSTDVHPPGSYVINKLALDLFGDWNAVKIFSGVINALALAIFGYMAFDHLRPNSRWVLAILLMGASTFVLWGASVRWYAYFNPVFTVALAFILFSSVSITARSIILVAASVILLHISYAAFCAAPVLAAAHLLRERNNLARRDLIVFFAFALLALLISLAQMDAFIHVHSKGRDLQVGGFFSALSSVATTLLLGNSVFPIGIAPALYALLIVALGLHFLFWQSKSRLDWIVLIALAAGAVAMIVTGLGTKPRNSVFLLPLVFLIVASSAGSLPAAFSGLAIAGIALFQTLGVTNIIAHRGTIKGSYNTDYLTAMDVIQSWRKSCKGNLIVFDHDTVLAYLLERAGIPQSSPFLSGGANQKDRIDLSANDCLVSVRTFRGDFVQDVLSSHYKMLDAGGLRETDSRNISEDANAKTKGWVAKETFPRYAMTLQRYDVVSPVSLPAWNFMPFGGYLGYHKR